MATGNLTNQHTSATALIEEALRSSVQRNNEGRVAAWMKGDTKQKCSRSRLWTIMTQKVRGFCDVVDNRTRWMTEWKRMFGVDQTDAILLQ